VLQESEEAQSYLEAHDEACKWAKINRHIIATRLVDQLNAECTQFLLDITHNNVVKISEVSAVEHYHITNLYLLASYFSYPTKLKFIVTLYRIKI
jgi:RNA-splicing ligase RtcB